MSQKFVYTNLICMLCDTCFFRRNIYKSFYSWTVMNIKSDMTGMNTCDTMERYITMPMASQTTPNLLPSLATPLPAIPWFMQGFCANPFPWQSLVFPPSPILPVPPMFQHQLFHCASPKTPNHTNKSFLIKDILGDSDSTSQTTAQATGRSKIYLDWYYYIIYCNFVWNKFIIV